MSAVGVVFSMHCNIFFQPIPGSMAMGIAPSFKSPNMHTIRSCPARTASNVRVPAVIPSA